MKSNKNLFRPGFTLVELLMAMTIFAGVAVVLYASFRNGIRIWSETKAGADFYQTARLSLDRLARDLKNSLDYTGIDFIGEKERLSFAGLVKRTPAAIDQSLIIGTISYYRDENEAAIIREAVPLGAGTDRRALAWPVETLNFSYLARSENDEYLWSDAWEELDRRPAFVKIEVRFRMPDSDEKVQFGKVIFLPGGIFAGED